MKSTLMLLSFLLFYSCCKMDKAVIVDMIRTPSHYETRSRSVTYKDNNGNNRSRTKYYQSYISERFEVKYMGYCYDPDKPSKGSTQVHTKSVNEVFFYEHKKGDTLIFNKSQNDW